MIGQSQEACPDAKIADAASKRDSEIRNLVAEDLSKEVTKNIPGTEKISKGDQECEQFFSYSTGLVGGCSSESKA